MTHTYVLNVQIENSPVEKHIVKAPYPQRAFDKILMRVRPFHFVVVEIDWAATSLEQKKDEERRDKFYKNLRTFSHVYNFLFRLLCFGLFIWEVSKFVTTSLGEIPFGNILFMLWTFYYAFHISKDDKQDKK